MSQPVKEYRSASLGIVEQEGLLRVEGYAALFEQPTVLFRHQGIEYKEVIDRDALQNTDMQDVIFKYNHSDNFLALARTRNNSLQLEVDELGLKISADLVDTTAGQDLYKLIKSRCIDKMSFAFTVAKASYDSQTYTRRILAIGKIFDISAVDTPAYDGTTIDVTSRCEESARAYFKEMLQAEEKRKRLYLMTY